MANRIKGISVEISVDTIKLSKALKNVDSSIKNTQNQLRFDSTMSEMSAVSGATGDDFDALRAKAREMSAKTKFSATEAANAMNYMAMVGWKTNDMLDGIEVIEGKWSNDDERKQKFTAVGYNYSAV